MRVSRGASTGDGNGRADGIGYQVVGRAHMKRIPAVRLVAFGGGRHGHIDIVVASSETPTVLVLLDPGNIDEKGNRRDVVELQRRM
jgi:hypothetical protein